MSIRANFHKNKLAYECNYNKDSNKDADRDEIVLIVAIVKVKYFFNTAVPNMSSAYFLNTKLKDNPNSTHDLPKPNPPPNPQKPQNPSSLYNLDKSIDSFRIVKH